MSNVAKQIKPTMTTIRNSPVTRSNPLWPESIPSTETLKHIAQIQFAIEEPEGVTLPIVSKNIFEPLHEQKWEHYKHVPKSIIFPISQLIWRRSMLCEMWTSKQVKLPLLKQYIKYHDMLLDKIWDEVDGVRGIFPQDWAPPTIIHWARLEFYAGRHSEPHVNAWKKENVTLPEFVPGDWQTFSKTLLSSTFPGTAVMMDFCWSWECVPPREKGEICRKMRGWLVLESMQETQGNISHSKIDIDLAMKGHVGQKIKLIDRKSVV